MNAGDSKKQRNPAADDAPSSSAAVYSIGHSNHELADFIALLQAAGVTAVADVRSRPYSPRMPWFNGPELKEGLRQHGIGYSFLGDQLGGRPEDADLYDAEGRADYQRMRQTASFDNGLDRLAALMAKQTVAMLCAEEDPLDCHRGLMITPALAERGLATRHIRRDGTVETPADFEERLLLETRVGEGVVDGLFGSLLTESDRQGLLQEALCRQARKKAFRLPTNPEKLEPEVD
jgi:hypothetical protein